MTRGEGFEAAAADRLADVFGEVAAGLARACDLIAEADRGQEFLVDGAPNMAQWLTARFGIDSSFGRRLVKVAHRLQDLPTLRDRFASGGLSFDAVELLSEFATSDTEAGLVDDAEGLDLAALQRMARRADPPHLPGTRFRLIRAVGCRPIGICIVLTWTSREDLLVLKPKSWRTASMLRPGTRLPTLRPALSTPGMHGWPTDWSRSVPPVVIYPRHHPS